MQAERMLKLEKLKAENDAMRENSMHIESTSIW